MWAQHGVSEPHDARGAVPLGSLQFLKRDLWVTIGVGLHPQSTMFVDLLITGGGPQHLAAAQAGPCSLLTLAEIGTVLNAPGMTGLCWLL